MADPRRKASDTTLAAFFLRFTAAHKTAFLLSFLLMPVYAWLLAKAPAIAQQAIDAGIQQGDFALTRTLSLQYLACVIGGFGALILHGVLMQVAGIRTLADLRAGLMRRIARLGKGSFDRRPVGVYVSRLTSDVEAIGETMTAGLTNILSDALLITFVYYNMIAVNRELGLWTLLILPVVVVIVDVFRRILRKLYDRIRTVNGLLTARVNESLGMLREVRNFHLEGYAEADFRKLNHEYRDRNVEAISLDALLFSILEGISMAAIGAVLLFSAHAASATAEGGLAIGAFVAYVQWLGMLFPPIKQMGSRFAVLQSALAAVAKVREVMAEPLPRDDGNEQPASSMLQLQDVSFAYQEDEPVLRHVSLEVPPRSSLAVVGPTGAGKSTLIRLLVRQFELNPGGGEILMGGLPLHRISREELKQRIVLVPQEPSVFKDTVLYNISLDRPGVTREQIEKVCRDIRAHDFIANLPNGYDTVLDSEGANLSMGQRQLIALARALAADAEILIFDEATANVDTETERLIQQALAFAMQHKTTILIAHRLSTIRDVDTIAVLQTGRIVDIGPHAELIKRPGLYRTMYNLQASDETHP